ncbi:MAG: hypothetical protein C0622_12115 [Desulfuromonas sp.]|nr:MAG: hypothetical protein C0622_12115 [Desulfuromonas sp.]
MRRLANIFLGLFLLAATLGLVTEGAREFFNTALPRDPAQLTWLLCFLCGGVIYLGYGFNRHLPLMILMPPQLWLLWGLLDHWPLDLLVGPRYRFYSYLIQLVIGLVALASNRILNDQSPWFVADQFRGAAFRPGRLVLFILLSIPFVPCVLLLIAYAVTDNLITEGSAGFVKLKPNGLYMNERIYRQGGKEIQLAGTIHLARPEYYEALNAGIPKQGTLILMEGVSDNNGLMKENFSYGRIADLMGLSQQQDGLFSGRLVTEAELAKTTPATGVDLLPADIDLSAFEPLTIEVLNAMAREVLNAEAPLAGYAEFSRWAEQNLPADFDKRLMTDLLDKRNRHVVTFLPQALKRYDTLVIPWGALHMRGIEQEVLAQGFTLEESRELLAIDFLLLPYDRILAGLTGSESTE